MQKLSGCALSQFGRRSNIRTVNVRMSANACVRVLKSSDQITTKGGQHIHDSVIFTYQNEYIVYPCYYLRCDLVIWICPFINYWMWASALMLMCISNCENELFFDKNQQATKSDNILVLFNIDSANQIIRQRTGEWSVSEYK